VVAEEPEVESLPAAIRRGAAGYLLRDDIDTEIFGDCLVRAANEDVLQISCGALLQLDEAVAGVRRARPAIVELTAAELTVLKGIDANRSRAQIAENLAISTRTVETVILHLNQKFAVYERFHLGKRAAQLGLVA
ncbi:MAG: LuxR C-terminal-related transcriptional regulator, partial [Dehalococcoidia bacterium]